MLLNGLTILQINLKHNNMNQHKIIEDEDKDDEEDEEEEEEDSPLKLRKFLETQQGNNSQQYFQKDEIQ